jgi:hypothetical protein
MRHEASILHDGERTRSKYSEGVDGLTVGISRRTIQQNRNLTHLFRLLFQQVTIIDPVSTDVPTEFPGSIFPQKTWASPQRTRAKEPDRTWSTRHNTRRKAIRFLDARSRCGSCTDCKSFSLDWHHPPFTKHIGHRSKNIDGPIKTNWLEICKKYRQEMFPDSIIGFNGSWSHRRGAKECVVVFVDCRTNKIVDFEIVQKPKFRLSSNYEGSSNGMEIAALQKLITRWKDNSTGVGCVHDCDAKASKAIRDAGWNVTESSDLNHIVKALGQKWQKMETGKLRLLQAKLRQWFVFLTQRTFSPEEREKYWLSTLEHFKGNHAMCPGGHPNLKLKVSLAQNPVGQEQLRRFLGQTIKLIWRIREDLRTQLCESFNELKHIWRVSRIRGGCVGISVPSASSCK